MTDDRIAGLEAAVEYERNGMQPETKSLRSQLLTHVSDHESRTATMATSASTAAANESRQPPVETSNAHPERSNASPELSDSGANDRHYIKAISNTYCSSVTYYSSEQGADS
jgi:hypothetical protein